MWVSAVAWIHLTGSGGEHRGMGLSLEVLFPLSPLTMKAVTTGSSEIRHFPCDFDYLTAEDFALQQATFQEAKRSCFLIASPI